MCVFSANKRRFLKLTIQNRKLQKLTVFKRDVPEFFESSLLKMMNPKRLFAIEMLAKNYSTFLDLGKE